VGSPYPSGFAPPRPIPTDEATTVSARILLVEDDAATRTAVAANLEAHGFRVTTSDDVASALRAWDAERPDLILLDLGLPDLDGSAVVRHVRRDATTPILILSARTDERVKVATLEAGADDYVTKPFGMDELRARVGAVLRRAAGPAADTTGVVRLGPIAMDIGGRRVTVDGNPVELTPREYELLKVMMAQPGRLLTKGRLLRAVWGTAYADEAHYLHVYVSRLRRKLAAADTTGAVDGLITAEPGIGYRIGDPTVRH
jgi:two-component system, OmpR family, KDP operon response regulator KdpE